MSQVTLPEMSISLGTETISRAKHLSYRQVHYLEPRAKHIALSQAPYPVAKTSISTRVKHLTGSPALLLLLALERE